MNAINVCHIWKALESDKVGAVLFIFRSRFTEMTKIWYQRLLKAIPVQHHENIFIVHTQYNGDNTKKVKNVQEIRRLSENANAKVSHVLNSIRLDDHRQEMLDLFKVWTSVDPFSVKNLLIPPPEIVYERYEDGPIKHKFSKSVEPRREFYQEVRREKTGKEKWNHGIFGKAFKLKKDVYGDKTYDLSRPVEEDMGKEEWIMVRNKYRIRYDQTRDFVEEEVIGTYVKSATDSGSADH